MGLCVFYSFLAVFLFSCQVFGLQNIQEVCNSPLGIQNGQIPDTRLSASSYTSLYISGIHPTDMKAKYSRLNHKYAWCTNKGKKVQSWLMVDLGKITNLTAIATQGYAGVNHYFVRSFKLAYSIDGTSWTFVGKDGTDTVFVGNKHGSDIKKNNFGQIEARYIKILPVTYFIRICLRIELYGCVKGSSIPTTVTPTTPLISTSKIPFTTKYPTSASTTKTSTSTTTTTTSITTKATSIKSKAKTSVYPTTSSTKLPSILTSSYTGTLSYQTSTTVQSSQSIPAASSRSSKGPLTVDKTTVQPSEGPVTLNALHRKGLNDGSDQKRNFIIIGSSIFVGLVFLVLLPLFVFWIFKRRTRTLDVSCQLVDLPEYPYQCQINCNGSIGHSNDLTLIEV